MADLAVEVDEVGGLALPGVVTVMAERCETVEPDPRSGLVVSTLAPGKAEEEEEEEEDAEVQAGAEEK